MSFFPGLNRQSGKSLDPGPASISHPLLETSFRPPLPPPSLVVSGVTNKYKGGSLGPAESLRLTKRRIACRRKFLHKSSKVAILSDLMTQRQQSMETLEGMEGVETFSRQGGNWVADYSTGGGLSTPASTTLQVVTAQYRLSQPVTRST